ncbi:MAG TPA: DUF188 domain-containing protein [Spirochaetales bacterium]|nr:DUF188 domain-containing protein [Spirochaetales bacterium]HPG85514.1 DUF188 domain-containing protein [Spirochaetales bacterium]HPM72224.1 DUF188 domain-containing protein [Spirochaetales bacterium]
MTLWADADSLPREVKELIGRRAGSSTGDFPIRAVFVANRPLPLPPGKNLQAVIVGKAAAQAGGLSTQPERDTLERDTADDYIIASAAPGDILVTRDIPLAARALERGLVALNDRGVIWTADSARERASVRDHMAALRELGVAPPLPKGRLFDRKDLKAFADALDKAIRAAMNAQRR